ncbi:MAG: UbiD family decarboxylase [Planctomycetaceae bacterium]|jgi:4-hydroxy-3-polyprenylbenzoate decarboxylase|nr:UbiD family decarboxylase [Planctomycetaceae bacterium]
MGYRNLQQCIDALFQTKQLVVFDEPVDACLEIAAVQRRLYSVNAPAVLFTNVKNCRFPMLANLYGTQKRVEYIFRDGIEPLRKIMTTVSKGLSKDNLSLPPPRQWLPLIKSCYCALPQRRFFSNSAPVLANQTFLDQLPQLVSWQDDGGAYITLPQVYTEGSAGHWGNLGMYRVQISGNDYLPNKEAGLHYQIQRGIALHHCEAIAAGMPLRVSIFIGGAPCMTVAAVMPMPENISELFFAGILGQHRIDMTAVNNTLNNTFYPVYAQADFCITGTLGTETKTEGPFGDHLGYYSLAHTFPVLKVDGVYHRKNAVFPFTVVGRPPQEDTQFGKFIHSLTGDALQNTIPGVKAVHAVDEAGVHPLLLAIGRETYLPLDKERRSAELHTSAHRILGSGQLSLAKYLFLAADDDPLLNVDDVPRFFRHVLERVDWRYDLHFVTKTTADTLDYSDAELHRGSKVFITVSGKPKRQLAETIDTPLPLRNPRVVIPGVLCAETIDIAAAEAQASAFSGLPLMVLVDDADEVSLSFRNFLWTTFTKSDPALDIHGIGERMEDKHWGCTGPLLIDARRKPHHAPELTEEPERAKRADAVAEKILQRFRAGGG